MDVFFHSNYHENIGVIHDYWLEHPIIHRGNLNQMKNFQMKMKVTTRKPTNDQCSTKTEDFHKCIDNLTHERAKDLCWYPIFHHVNVSTNKLCSNYEEAVETRNKLRKVVEERNCKVPCTTTEYQVSKKTLKENFWPLFSHLFSCSQSKTIKNGVI